jgi:outer membrane protein OmpA-like peptidoglycan-associated protein
METQQMKNHILTTLTLTSVLLASGCATKKYVSKTTDPIKDRVGQVAAQSDKQGQDISQQGSTITKQGTDLERNQTEINANKERAMAADARAGDALKKGDENSRDLGELRQTVANLDDYRPAGTAVLPFGFNKDNLTSQGKQELDTLVADKKTAKRFFIAVEGFTDQVGTSNYNDALSRRRADRVVQYLVAKHDIPIFRIHEIGLGKEKPAEQGKTRAANAKNRRVEVTFYSADAAVTAMK